MGKVLWRFLHSIMPNWISKLKILDGAPRRLLFFRRRGGSTRSSTGAAALSLVHSEDDDNIEPSSSGFSIAHLVKEATSIMFTNEPAMEASAATAKDTGRQAASTLTTAIRDDAPYQKELDVACVHPCHYKRKSECLQERDDCRSKTTGGEWINKTPLKKQRKCCRRSSFSTVLPTPLSAILGATTAMVRISSDPYTDFWESMNEMIVENGLWEFAKLEHLLFCYLSLNDPQLYSLIEKAFVQVLADLEKRFFQP